MVSYCACMCENIARLSSSPDVDAAAARGGVAIPGQQGRELLALTSQRWVLPWMERPGLDLASQPEEQTVGPASVGHDRSPK